MERRKSFVLPLATHRIDDATSEPFVGAVALELNDNKLRERGRITHLKKPPQRNCETWFEDTEDETEIERQYCWVNFDWRANIQRSLVIGEKFIHYLLWGY